MASLGNGQNGDGNETHQGARVQHLHVRALVLVAGSSPMASSKAIRKNVALSSILPVRTKAICIFTSIVFAACISIARFRQTDEWISCLIGQQSAINKDASFGVGLAARGSRIADSANLGLWHSGSNHGDSCEASLALNSNNGSPVV